MRKGIALYVSFRHHLSCFLPPTSVRTSKEQYKMVIYTFCPLFETNVSNNHHKLHINIFSKYDSDETCFLLKYSTH